MEWLNFARSLSGGLYRLLERGTGTVSCRVAVCVDINRRIMKKVLAGVLLWTSVSVQAQQANVLLEQSFWKSKPDVAAVKEAIEKGNDPLAFTPSAFDPTVLAINNEAPNATIKYMLEQPGITVSRLTHDGRVYLHWAANRGNAEIVEYLLAKGADINAEDSRGSTPLAFSAGQPNAAVYEAFFKAGIDPKKKYRDGANLLLLSIAGDKDLVLTNYFISRGMSLNDKDDKGNTAFDYAARSGNIEFLKNLLAKGVKYTNSALLMAAAGYRGGATGIDTYRYLVEELKINPSAVNAAGETVLHQLVRKPKQEEIIGYFIGKGVDVNKADKDGNTAFMLAARGRDLALLELLLPKVKDINAVNAKGESALTQAIRYGSAEAAAFLVGKKANVKLLDKDGNNLGVYLVQSYRPAPAGSGAAADEFTAKMNLLKEKGLNLAAPQKDGNTLYHLAAARNELGLLEKLQALQIDVNAKNKEGITAMHKAAMVAKDDSILKYLLSVGAKKDITTGFDETAYDLAKENEFLARKNISLDFLQ